MRAQDACNKGDLSTADSVLSQLKVSCLSKRLSAHLLLCWSRGADDSPGHPRPSAVGQWLDSWGSGLQIMTYP